MDRTPSEYHFQKAGELLAGAADMHTHSAPCVFPRRADDRQTAEEAGRFGMTAVVLKSHEGDTAARAAILRSESGIARAFGGIVLNHFIGGLNPAAVEVSLRLDGRFVWFPTVSAAQHVDFFKGKKSFLGGSFKHGPGEGISLIREDGGIEPEIYDILDLVSEAGAVMCTGHVSFHEALAVARAHRDRKGSGHFVFTHPDLSINQAPLEAQIQVAEWGGYIEKCTLACHPGWGNTPLESFIRSIREIGAERCFLSTDAGGPDRPSSPETLQTFLAGALEASLTEQEIHTMLVEVPSRLLDL